MLKLARCRARLRENSCPVSILVGIDDSNSVIKGVRLDDQKGRPKDLLPKGTPLILPHVRMTTCTYL
jgi:hypothetical protein